MWEPTLKVAQLSGRQVPRCGPALAAQLEEAIAQRLAVTTPGQAQTAQIVAGYFASLADHPAGEEVPPADPPTQPESMK